MACDEVGPGLYYPWRALNGSASQGATTIRHARKGSVMSYRRSLLILASSVCVASVCLAQTPSPGSPDDEPKLTDEQKQQFLLVAMVVDSKQLGKGVTHPWRLTL